RRGSLGASGRRVGAFSLARALGALGATVATLGAASGLAPAIGRRGCGCVGGAGAAVLEHPASLGLVDRGGHGLDLHAGRLKLREQFLGLKPALLGYLMYAL